MGLFYYLKSMNKKKRIIRDIKRSKKAQSETNDQAFKKIMLQAGQHSCKYCAPWKNENRVKRQSKRGAKKPKYKNKRK